MHLIDGNLTDCTVHTYLAFETIDTCKIDPLTRTITITDTFAHIKQSPPNKIGYSNQIKIFLKKVRNPLTNEGTGSYTIKTFLDQNQTYLIDELKPELLFFDTQCDFPCASCSPNTRSQCSSCWPENILV